MAYFTIFPDFSVTITIIIYSRAPVISGNVVKIKIIALVSEEYRVILRGCLGFRQDDGDVKSLVYC